MLFFKRFVICESHLIYFIWPFLQPYMGVIPNPKMAFIFPISCILAIILPILMKYFPKCESFLKSKIKSPIIYLLDGFTDCGGLRKPVHGLVNVSGETTLGNIATYYCEPGFDLIGHQNRACGTDGTWSGVPPICQPKGRYCTRPHSGETTLGNIASYYCEPGFDLIGHQNRACGTDGTWSGVPPICQPKGRNCTRPHSGETTLGNIATTTVSQDLT